MADTLTFDLVSPERLLISEEVTMVVVPGSEGDFGVMVGHTPVITTLRPGVVEVHASSGDQQRIYVRGGFAETTGDNLTILAEEAINLADLDRAKLEQRLANAREDIGLARDDEERRAAEMNVAQLTNLLTAL
jgi:F-type H+-transporting ATPase subunit epsilon